MEKKTIRKWECWRLRSGIKKRIKQRISERGKQNKHALMKKEVTQESSEEEM